MNSAKTFERVTEDIANKSFDGEETVQTQSEEMDEVLSYVEEAYDDMQTLDAIQDTMESSVEEGNGLDDTAVQIAEIAIEAIRAKLSLQSYKQGNFSLEAFKDTEVNKVNATRLAIEAVEGEKQSIFKRIGTAIEAFIQKIVEFVTGFFQNAEKLRDKLKQLKQESQKNPRTTNGYIQSKYLYAAIAIDGKADSSTMETLIQNANNFLDISADASKKFERIGTALANASFENKDSIMFPINRIMSDITRTYKQVTDLHLVNNKATHSKEYDSNDGVTITGLDIVTKQQVDGTEIEEIPMLSGKQQIELLEKADSLLLDLIRYKGEAKALIDLLKYVSKTAEKHFKTQVKDKKDAIDTETRDAFFWANSILQKVTKDLIMLPTDTAYRTAKAVAQYVTSSIAWSDDDNGSSQQGKDHDSKQKNKMSLTLVFGKSHWAAIEEIVNKYSEQRSLDDDDYNLLQNKYVWYRYKPSNQPSSFEDDPNGDMCFLTIDIALDIPPKIGNTIHIQDLLQKTKTEPSIISNIKLGNVFQFGSSGLNAKGFVKV